MIALLDDPLVQAGFGPFLVALAIAGALARTRAAWLALSGGVLCAVVLSTGLSFTPLSASRKIVLCVLLAPLLGLSLDWSAWRHKMLLPLLALGGALVSLWVFQGALAQMPGTAGWALGGAVALFTAAVIALMARLRDDGAAAGAATLGLGVGSGIVALLSASVGNLMNGLALGMGGAALLLLQLLRGQSMAPGWTGVLSAGLAAALFAAATVVLAEGRWFVLALLLVVPAAAALPWFASRAPRQRLVLLGLSVAAVALFPIAAAWLATGHAV